MKRILSVMLALMLMLAASASAVEVGLKDFSTVDMEGNTVTQDIFANYDLTMVNVWATWCVYCIEEMPDFAVLKEMLPENVNLITICDDASVEPELVKQILSDSNANFTTLIPTQEMYDQLLSYVYAFPTTFFVNSEGVPVIQPLEGVPSLESPAEAYYTIITEILKLMEA